MKPCDGLDNALAQLQHSSHGRQALRHIAELEAKLTDGGVYIEVDEHYRIVAELDAKLERYRNAIQHCDPMCPAWEELDE